MSETRVYHGTLNFGPHGHLAQALDDDFTV